MQDHVAGDIDAVLLETQSEVLSYFLASCEVLAGGTVYETRKRVDTINETAIYIYPNDHGPAHVHIRNAGKEASFDILSGELLVGDLGFKENKVVRYYLKSAKDTLIKEWNKLNTR